MKKFWVWTKNNWALVFILCVIIFGSAYYLFLHQTPFTQNAYVVSNVRTVTALVDGYITNVYVTNNQKIKANQPLFSVFKIPYELALEQLKNSLQAELYQKRALEFTLEDINQQIIAQNAMIANAEYLYMQAKEMLEKQATSQKNTEVLKNSYLISLAKLKQLEAQLEATKQKVLSLDSQISATKNQIGIAEINLEQTTVYALEDGIVNNMFISPGTFVNAGTTLFGCVSDKEYFIQANIEETELGLVQKNQKATIYLWQYPGRKFHGIVSDINWNVNRNHTSANGLQFVAKENEWFLLPQRFPVQIRLIDVPDDIVLHNGGSAYVKIDTSSQMLRNFIWRLFLI